MACWHVTSFAVSASKADNHVLSVEGIIDAHGSLPTLSVRERKKNQILLLQGHHWRT
jgi:hypothetical protein